MTQKKPCITPVMAQKRATKPLKYTAVINDQKIFNLENFNSKKFYSEKIPIWKNLVQISETKKS